MGKSLQLKVSSIGKLSVFLILILISVSFIFNSQRSPEFILFSLSSCLLIALVVIRGVSYLCVSLALLFSFIPSDYSLFLSVSTPIGVIPLYMLLISVLFCFTIFYREKIIWDNITISFYILLFLSILALCINFSFKYFVPLVKYYILSFCIYNLVVIFNNKCDDDKFINTIIAFCLIANLVSIISIAECLLNFDISFLYSSDINGNYEYWQRAQQNFLWRANSTVGNPVVLGCYLSMALVLSSYLWEKKYVYAPIFYFFNIVGILLTVSKSAILFVILYSLYNLLLVNKRIIEFLGIVIVIFAVVFFAVDTIPYIDMIWQRIFQDYGDISYLHRMNAITYFLDFWEQANFIFGEGIGGNYALLQSIISQDNGILFTNTLDNAWLDNILAFGVIGMATILRLFYILLNDIKYTNKILEKKKYIEIIFTFLYYTLFFDSFRYQASWGYFWIIVSFFLVYMRRNRYLPKIISK